MRGWFVQLFSKGLPWVALVVVTGFGLRQLQLRKSAQGVAPVPLSATVPVSESGRAPVDTRPTSVPETNARPSEADVPAHVREWYAAADGVVAQPPVLRDASRVASAFRRVTTESARTHALLATARARADAEAAARAACREELDRARDAPERETTPAPDPALVRWAVRLEDVASGDDVRRMAALRAATEAVPRTAATPLMRLASENTKHHAAAVELAAALPPDKAADDMLVELLEALNAGQQATIVTRIGLERFTRAGLAARLFRAPSGAAARAIAALGVEGQAGLDDAARAQLHGAALEGLRKGSPAGVAAGARLLAVSPGALPDVEFLTLRAALERLTADPESQEAAAAVLTVLAHRLTATQRARDAKDLRRRALDAMASEHAVVRAAGHRLAVSISAHALLFDPYAPEAKRRASHTRIEAAWR